MRNYKSTGRPRGAPRGNTNAIKYGLYSHHISAQEQSEVQDMLADQNQDELVLARVRLKQCLERQSSASPDHWLDFERLIAHYLRLIVSMTQKNALLGRDQHTAYLTVMEMVQSVNEEQHVS